MIEVYDVGTLVVIGGDIEGFVVCVAIYANDRIMYQVSWWNGKTRNCEWLEDWEVIHKAPCTSKVVGFIPARPEP